MWRAPVTLGRSMELVYMASKRRPMVCYVHTSRIRPIDVEPLKPSSKVEMSVSSFKHDVNKVPVIEQDKKLMKRIKDELIHYYHGFRLLFINVGISWGFVVRVMNGEPLTRREKKQLIRTTSDLFRLVPFSVFIIVPFMELTLPIFLKFFPNMLPSTFQTASERDAKLKATLKVKLEMAKFLQQTLDEMAVNGDGRQSRTAKEFADFFAKMRNSGLQPASVEEILKFSKLFEDEITLDSLNRPQLMALCRVLEIPPIGPSNLLRFQLRTTLRNLAADDKLIKKEGVDSLSVAELQAACRARGMRSLGVSQIRLKSQLLQWLDLSLDEKVPPSLLLLSRALYLPDTVPATEQLQATIASLPESVATHTRDAISQKRGKVDYKARIETLRLEQAKIRQERLENTPVNSNSEYLTITEAAVLEKALLSIAIQRNKQFLIEKGELIDLKEEMAEYQAAVNELHQLLMHKPRVVRESKAARRLFKHISRMISHLDGSVTRLEAAQNGEQKCEDANLRIDELISSVQRIQFTDSSQLRQILQILHNIDQDRDGVIQVDDVLKVIQLLEEEESRMSPKHMSDMLNLVKKEEALEMEEKLAKSLVDSTDKHQGSEAALHAFSVENLKKSQEAPIRDVNNVQKPAPRKHTEQRPAQKTLANNNVCDVKADYLFTVEGRKLMSKTGDHQHVESFLLDESAGIRPRSAFHE